MGKLYIYVSGQTIIKNPCCQAVATYAKQKHLARVQKAEANQKQQLSDYTCD